jgi:hypothetical protein
MKIDVIDCILKINPKAVVNVDGNNIDTCEIEWLEGTTPISKEDIKAQIPIIEQEEEDKKTNKVSAYRKLEMTDNEILAIDPTLEEYL